MRNKGYDVGTLLATIPVGCHPIDLVLDEGDGKAYVANKGNLNDGGTVGGSVSFLDEMTGQVSATVALGVELDAIAVDPATHHIFVADSGYSATEGPDQGTPAGPALIITLDAVTGKVLNTAQVGAGPQVMQVAPEHHRLIVANQNDGTLTILDTRTGAVVEQLAVGQGPAALAIVPDSGIALVANYGSGTVTMLDFATIGTRAIIKVERTPGWLAVDVGTQEVLVTQHLAHRVSAVDTRTGSILYALSVAPCPTFLVSDAPSRRVVIAHDPHDGRGALTILEGGAPRTGRTIACTLPLAATPAAMALDEQAGYLYVAQFGFKTGTGALAILDLDAACGDAMLVNTVPVGPVPRKVAVAAQAGRVFVVSDTQFVRGHEADEVNGSVSLFDAGRKESS